MRFIGLIISVATVVSASFAFAGLVLAECETGEIKIKFSHVTNADKHPKGIAAALLESRVNKEMNGKACMEVFPNSTLFDDNKVLEAMLNGDIQLAAPSLCSLRSLDACKFIAACLSLKAESWPRFCIMISKII